jgi:hypothetical protein
MNNQCDHRVTRGRDGERGSWCVACDVKVLEVHDRACNECRYYEADTPFVQPPVCTRKNMFITRTMHVCYFIGRPEQNGGLCFEQKEEPSHDCTDDELDRRTDLRSE